MNKKPSLTILVPAFNEEGNILPTIAKLSKLRHSWGEYKIKIYNDASTDATEKEALKSIEQFPELEIEVYNNQTNQNLGGIFKRGVTSCDTDYLIMIHGQNDITLEMLEEIFKHKDKDIIIPYPINTHERSWTRRVVSYCFTRLLNTLGGYNIRYYNHYALFKTSLLNKTEDFSSSFAFQADIIIQLLRHKPNFLEVPITDVYDQSSKTSAFRIHNIIGVLKFIIRICLRRKG